MLKKAVLQIRLVLMLVAALLLCLWFANQSVEPLQHGAIIYSDSGEPMIERIVEPRFRWEIVVYIGLFVIAIVETYLAHALRVYDNDEQT